MSPAPLALALALTVSQPAGPLAEHIWAHCATQPTYVLRQACLQQQIEYMQGIVARSMRDEPERTRICRAAARDYLLDVVLCLAEPGAPL